MRKKIQVKHTHRYTKSENILFVGYALCSEYDQYREINYVEKDGTKVVMYMFKEYMVIERYGEVHSQLNLHRKQTTKNPMKSEYGTFEIEIHTFAYQCDPRYIMVEYDVENGSDSKDGFKIEIEVMEEAYEYN
ncbi:MAG: DUF1934 family protein [Erysipelotrichia bacterium]|nr:DUF1934 family protein [Erysipelotrichia bacterium]NCC54727.1 DUF1934 family protein [Erysipelotrichia bacterium]